MAEPDVVVVLVTVPNAEAGRMIAGAIVDERLAACVNVVGPIRSIYRWEGAVRDDEEYLLVVKTRATLLPTLETRVRGLHDYDLPEVVALPVSGGSARYLDWVRVSTGGGAG
jgi:periplasmic divalent cation tolerance protein